MSERTSGLVRVQLVFILLLAACALLLVLNANTGSVRIAPLDVFRIVLLRAGEGTSDYNVLWKIRLPRLLAAAVLGGALSVSGFLLQTFFRNPIAGPYVMGISSGAKMCVGLVTIFMLKQVGGMPFYVTMLAAFGGSMLCTGFVLLFARRIHSMAMLLVVGIMVGNICSAITDFMISFAVESEIANLTAWSLGSFSAISWQNLTGAAAVIGVTLVGVFMMSKPIGACALG